MSDSNLRKLVCQALEKSNGLTVEQTEEAVRRLGWVFYGIASFAVLGVLKELSEENLATAEKGKYKLVPGREQQARRPARKPKKTNGGDMRTFVLGKRFFPDDVGKRERLTEAVRDLIAQARKEKERVVVVETVGEEYQVTMGTKQATGHTITEAIGSLMVLNADELGFDFQAKE